jgi:hypothetical protein
MMSKARRRLIVGLVALLAVAVVATGFVYVSVSSPTILIGVGPTRLAVLSNAAAAAVPDPPADSSGDAGPIPAGGCLDRITRPGGWLDLCWSVKRMMNEIDAQKDYYVLRVIGTLSGNPFPSGLRWAAVRVQPDPASAPVDDLGDWPGSAVFEGPCRELSAGLNGAFGDEMVSVCGHTAGYVDPGSPLSTGVDWTCAGCLLPMSTTQAVVMSGVVSVDEGKTPSWDLYADIGS